MLTNSKIWTIASYVTGMVAGGLLGLAGNYLVNHEVERAELTAASGVIFVLFGGFGLLMQFKAEENSATLVDSKARTERALEERYRRIEKVSDDFLHRSESFNQGTTPLERVQALREAGISLLADNEEIRLAFERIDAHGKRRTPNLSQFTTDPKRLFDALARWQVELRDAVSWGAFLLHHADEVSLPDAKPVESPVPHGPV